MLLEFTNFHLVPLHMSNEEFIVKSYIFFSSFLKLNRMCFTDLKT